MMKKIRIFTITILITLMLVGSAAAQDSPGLKLGLSRDFGYGGIGNDIQGLFSMSIKDPPEDLTSVDFMIDGQVIFSDSEAPFRTQFTTDNYALGEHTLSARGVTASGQELSSNELVMEFVAAGEGMAAAGKIIGPVFGLIAVVMMVTFIIPVLMVRRKGQTLPLGAPRNWGVTGGTICPKCKRAFAMHFFAPNVVVGKFDICPHCGKWSVVRAYPRDVLEASVAAESELAKAQGVKTVESTEEKLRKELDDSKYQDV
jgi:hypothetical protein